MVGLHCHCFSVMLGNTWVRRAMIACFEDFKCLSQRMGFSVLETRLFAGCDLRASLRIYFGAQANLFDSGRPQEKSALASNKADFTSVPECKNLLLVVQKQLLQLSLKNSGHQGHRQKSHYCSRKSVVPLRPIAKAAVPHDWPLILTSCLCRSWRCSGTTTSSLTLRCPVPLAWWRCFWRTYAIIQDN
jgi:hypothetical protein